MRFTGLDRAHASLLSVATIMSLSSAPTFAAASQADQSATNESVQVTKSDSEGTFKITPPSPAAAAESLALIKQAYSNMAVSNWSTPRICSAGRSVLTPAVFWAAAIWRFASYKQIERMRPSYS